MLLFYCICEAVASKYVGFYFMLGADNPTNVLSKQTGGIYNVYYLGKEKHLQ